MQAHFYIKDHEARRHLISTNDVARVSSYGQGVEIVLRGGEHFRTNTYDLEGFATNVLSNDLLEEIMEAV